MDSTKGRCKNSNYGKVQTASIAIAEKTANKNEKRNEKSNEKRNEKSNKNGKKCSPQMQCSACIFDFHGNSVHINNALDFPFFCGLYFNYKSLKNIEIYEKNKYA